MSYSSDVRRNIASLEHSKFVEITNDVRFPAISTTRVQYTESSDIPPVSTVEVYPRHAVVAYIANAADITGGGGSGSSNPYPQASNWDILSVSFSSGYVAFPSAAASVVNVVNNTGTTISIKKTSGAVGMPLPDRSSADISVVSNANEISVCRTDLANTPLTTYAIITRY